MDGQEATQRLTGNASERVSGDHPGGCTWCWIIVLWTPAMLRSYSIIENRFTPTPHRPTDRIFLFTLTTRIMSQSSGTIPFGDQND